MNGSRGNAAESVDDRSPGCRGFTLIELLVVMTILGLLLSLALPRYWHSIDRAEEAVLQENLNSLRSSIDKFYADKGRYPEDLQEIVSQGYLRAVPLDPITESADTWIIVPPPNPDESGVADTRSGARGSTTNGVPYEDL